MISLLIVMALTLPMKIDTVRVDTVGYEYDCSESFAVYYCLDSIGADSTYYSHIECDDSTWTPTLKYTTDTTYYLTPEQVKRIEKRIEVDVVECDSVEWSYPRMKQDCYRNWYFPRRKSDQPPASGYGDTAKVLR